MTEPKLLTEAELRDSLTGAEVACWRQDKIVRDFRERGLIAPEPVDPLLIEAREIAGKTLHRLGASAEQIAAGEITSGQRDDAIIVHATLAALRRGMELAECPTLTEDAVEDAYLDACNRSHGRFTKALHAALMERLS